MRQKIKSYIFAAVTILTLAVPALAPAAVTYADNISDAVCQGTNIAATNDPNSTVCTANASTSDLGTLAKKVVNIFSIIVGVVAVLMIIYGGFRYITSGGDSGSVGNAKNTLIYAIVGLIIVALAQFIVHFVLSNVSSVQQ